MSESRFPVSKGGPAIEMSQDVWFGRRSLTLGDRIGAATRRFCFTQQLPMCDELWRRHQLTVISNYVSSFFSVHRFLELSREDHT
jgi:hypothetical protein